MLTHDLEASEVSVSSKGHTRSEKLLISLSTAKGGLIGGIAGNITGTFSINDVALLTPEELDEAIKKSVDFHPPGH